MMLIYNIMLTIELKFDWYILNFSFLRECLSIWARSPKAYQQLRGSGLLLLPSPRTLTLYKNSNEQGPRVHDFMLHWMVQEAERLSVPPYVYCRGIMFDEMSLQVNQVLP